MKKRGFSKKLEEVKERLSAISAINKDHVDVLNKKWKQREKKLFERENLLEKKLSELKKRNQILKDKERKAKTVLGKEKKINTKLKYVTKKFDELKIKSRKLIEDKKLLRKNHSEIKKKLVEGIFEKEKALQDYEKELDGIKDRLQLESMNFELQKIDLLEKSPIKVSQDTNWPLKIAKSFDQNKNKKIENSFVLSMAKNMRSVEKDNYKRVMNHLPKFFD